MNVIEKCTLAADKMRKDALKMSLQAGNAHLGGGLSLIEIMAVLYMGVMKYNVLEPVDELRDRLIFSKGHGTLALYTALNQAGFITDEQLGTFKQNDTILYGHPSMNSEIGIEFSSGSLGQGLSLGVGTCIGLRWKNNVTSRVFVILGDGECDEGSIWEAAAAASHYKLSNLIAVVDKNRLQYDGPTNQVMSMDCMKDKWQSFGWNAIEVDGHNVSQLYDMLRLDTDRPKAIIANTIKGKGVSFMENIATWHHAQFTQKHYEDAMRELGGLGND